MYCAQCKGHLVSSNKLETIKRVTKNTREQLKEEATSEVSTDLVGTILCPRCRRKMRKEQIRVPALTLYIDHCAPCSLVWLDGGELALIQLAYESSHHFVNTQELKQRIQELEASPERKSEFEVALARLPQGENVLKDALKEVLTETGIKAIWRKILYKSEQI